MLFFLEFNCFKCCIIYIFMKTTCYNFVKVLLIYIFFKSLQHNQFLIAQMAIDLIASRYMVRNAAIALQHNKKEAVSLCASAKYFTTGKCFDVSIFSTLK